MKIHSFIPRAMGLCACLLATPVRADLLIEETFTGYPDNALISASPAGAALGLTGDWSLFPDSDFFVNRTRADFEAGTGKAVYQRPPGDNGTRTATRLASAEPVLFTNAGDTFYASFRIQPALTNGDMTFEIGLRNLNGGGTPDFSFGIINGAYVVGNGGVDVDLGGGAVISGEQRVVVRVEYGDALTGGTGDNETVTLWVNPGDETSTPVIDRATADFLTQGGGKITSVSLRGDQMSGGAAFFDDLRVGTTFVSVVPEPAMVTLHAAGFAVLLPLVWRRRMTGVGQGHQFPGDDDAIASC